MLMEIYDEYREVAEKNAGYMAKAKLCREKLKALLSVIILRYLEGSTSVAKAEVMARASEEYKIHLRGAEEVIALSEVARSKLKSLEMKHESERSANALKRAEIKLL
jgi:hypothetical protein